MPAATPKAPAPPSLLDKLGTLYPPLRHEIVAVLGPDGTPSGLEVEVRELTAGARLAVTEAATALGADGETRLRVSLLYPHLVQRCCYDPATGNLLWKPSQIEAVNALPHQIMTQLGNIALRVNGLAKADEEETAGNAGEASGDGSSNSPSA